MLKIRVINGKSDSKLLMSKDINEINFLTRYIFV